MSTDFLQITGFENGEFQLCPLDEKGADKLRLEVVVIVCQLWPLVYVFDVMHHTRLHCLSVSGAPSAAVPVSALYYFCFAFPFLAVVIKYHLCISLSG